MGSPLDFVNSRNFRIKVTERNLPPYSKSPFKASQPINYEYVVSDYSVKDSPDALIDTPRFANLLYKLNKWGADGGYKQVPDPTGILSQKSNAGEYGSQRGKIIDQAPVKIKESRAINKYGTGGDNVLDSAPFFASLEQPKEPGKQGNLVNNQPYPSTFVPSSYSPVSILLSSDPQGSDGLLSQDSFIARLGAFTLRKEFEERIAAQIIQDTVGRANLFNADGASDLLRIINGDVPLIQPNYTITVPENPVLAATSFILRLGGSIIPVSPIPGSYFDDGISMRQPTTVDQLQDAYRDSVVGNVVNTLLGTNLTGSEIFYNNTGSGQKALLFRNINFNKYKPSFDRTLFNRLAGLLVGSTTDNSSFYVGSNTTNPSRIFSPSREIPINSYGQEVQAQVYGSEELSELYEPISEQIQFGPAGPAYVDGGGIEGGFTWVSPKYKGNAGKKVGVGGLVGEQDEDFKPSSYNATESTNVQYRSGSILDDTQRLINSQPQGGRRLRHVGNAIDQVSKVFNDGYREITKGSRVIRYVGEIGQEVGTEYCRVFTKDTPYLQFNDLQKTDGVVTEGRRFSYSVLDKTYNLNIAPNKQEGGQSSTNLINGPGGSSVNDAYAKKYMFSLENLAWRTSSTPGFTTSDLPICERGPNGGRVMWFPPYALTFSETVSTGWKDTTFLGRPEPIYTYQNTSRTGSLSWSIVVDHPSVLNVITNKVLSNETNKTRVDSIITSFFAGCRKYDLYELAKKYYTVNPNDLLQIQQALNSKELSAEQLDVVKNTIVTGVDSPNTSDQQTAPQLSSDKFNKFVERGFYFQNNSPENMDDNFSNTYNLYTSSVVRDYYNSQPNSEETNLFFDSVVIPNFNSITAFTQELKIAMDQTNGTVTIALKASSSAPQDENYKKEIEEKRISSVISYFNSDVILSKYIKEGRLLFDVKSAFTDNEKVQPQTFNGTDFSTGELVDCSAKSPNADTTTINGDSTGNKDITTFNAMACRSVRITRIDVKLTEKTNTGNQNPNSEEIKAGNTVIGSKKKNSTPQEIFGDGISKKILRMLMSECDYFEVMKEETPLVFDNLKDKLKYFQPAFHSTTPEGLNSRLTFLQQCMRPGDTIPTVKDVNGTQVLQYNNATNTSFGTPPVLILRVGDFYHTKILPDNLQIQYENLDLNPEGIGIQPMIAKVTLSFKFVGGQGLKNSVDKLQNALTFNYYGNTEMWDERADFTDESFKVYDKEFLPPEAETPSPPAINEGTINNGQSNASPIGTIISSEVVDGFDVGVLSYSSFMEKVKNETANYFQIVVAKQKETTNQYNNSIRQMWQFQRNYTDGFLFPTVGTDITNLFGKPENVQKSVDTIFKDLIDDIKDNDDLFILHMSQKERNLSDKVIRQLKESYVMFLKNKNGTFLNALTTIIQDIVNFQQNYVQTLGRVNTIVWGEIERGTDGYQKPDGNVVIYNTSGTTKVDKSSTATNTMKELEDDISIIRDDLQSFDLVTVGDKELVYQSKTYNGRLVLDVSGTKGKASETIYDFDDVFSQFSFNEKFSNLNFKRQYTLLSDDIIDSNKYQTFKDLLIGKIINNKTLIGDSSVDLEKYFDEYWLNLAKPLFSEENAITLAFIDNMEKNYLQKYLNYTPFDTKSREFLFTTEPISGESYVESQKKIINNLGLTVNYGNNVRQWEDDIKGTVYPAGTSKVKFN